MSDRPWQHLRSATERIDALVGEVAALVCELADPVSTAADDQVLIGVAHTTVRDLSASTARLRHAAVALEVLGAGLIEEHHSYRDDIMTTARLWLARHHGISRHDASVLCRATQSRARYDLLDQAFVAGELTLGHLDAVAHIIPARLKDLDLQHAIEAVADIQAVLLDAAGDSTVEEFRALCAQVRDRLDSDGPADRATEPSRVWITQLPNGRWALKGDLSAIDGALLASMIADVIAANRRKHTNTQPEPDATPAESEPSEAAPADATPAEAAPADDEPWVPQSEQAAAALLELARDGAGTNKAGRIALYLHVDLDQFTHTDTDGLDTFIRTGGTTAHTEAGIDLDTNSLWSLLADADIVPVFNWDGTPLSYGRTRRLAPPVLRRILAHRDRRCRIPGCTSPPNRCDIHHVTQCIG